MNTTSLYWAGSECQVPARDNTPTLHTVWGRWLPLASNRAISTPWVRDWNILFVSTIILQRFSSAPWGDIKLQYGLSRIDNFTGYLELIILRMYRFLTVHPRLLFSFFYSGNLWSRYAWWYPVLTCTRINATYHIRRFVMLIIQPVSWYFVLLHVGSLI